MHAQEMADAIGAKFVKLVGAKHFTWYDNLDGTVKPMEDFLK